MAGASSAGSSADLRFYSPSMEPGNVLPHIATHRQLEMRFTGVPFAALGASALLFACSIDVGPFFTPPEIPENQLAFNGGKIGLLTPALTKENELIAFRLLSGLKMDQRSATAGRKASVGTVPG